MCITAKLVTPSMFLFQMFHNNVLEFCIVTTDENECNWMMFVRKAR